MQSSLLLFSASWCISAVLFFPFSHVLCGPTVTDIGSERLIGGDTGSLVLATSGGVGGSCVGAVKVTGLRVGAPLQQQSGEWGGCLSHLWK